MNTYTIIVNVVPPVATMSERWMPLMQPMP